MKNFKLLVFTIVAILLFSACKKNVKESIQTSIPEKTIIQKEVDYYFTESLADTSSYGPYSITRNVLQDKKGHFWMATWQGIIHYDGTTFTNFTNKEGLRRFRAFSLLEDSKGNIWIGTIGGAGIYKYDGSTFENMDTDDGLVNNDVGCIYEDDKGIIWFGTRVGISKYNGQTFTNFTMDNGLIANDINSIIQDDTGKYWIGARGFAFTSDGTNFEKIINQNGMSYTNVRCIMKDKNDHIWMGGNDGLWRYDGKAYNQIIDNFTGYIFEDSNGNIWTAQSSPSNTYNMDLIKHEPLPLPAHGVQSEKVWDLDGQVFGINEDNVGNIWFGTEKGICKYDGNTFEYFKRD